MTSVLYTAMLFTVLVSPNEVIAYAPGGSATYLCITSASFHPGAVRSVRWYMNGSPIEDAERVNKQFFSGLGRLDFTNVTLNLDNSRINCAAEFDLGEMENSSTYSQLLVQGENQPIVCSAILVG